MYEWTRKYQTKVFLLYVGMGPETTPATAMVTVVPSLNEAIRDELEDAMRRNGLTPNAYFAQYDVDKRNFYKALSRNPQIGWIKQHTDRLGVTIGVFFDAVDARMKSD